jgi:hypothetical protein
LLFLLFYQLGVFWVTSKIRHVNFCKWGLFVLYFSKGHLVWSTQRFTAIISLSGIHWCLEVKLITSWFRVFVECCSRKSTLPRLADTISSLTLGSVIPVLFIVFSDLFFGFDLSNFVFLSQIFYCVFFSHEAILKYNVVPNEVLVRTSFVGAAKASRGGNLGCLDNRVCAPFIIHHMLFSFLWYMF